MGGECGSIEEALAGAPTLLCNSERDRGTFFGGEAPGRHAIDELQKNIPHLGPGTGESPKDEKKEDLTQAVSGWNHQESPWSNSSLTSGSRIYPPARVKAARDP